MEIKAALLKQSGGHALPYKDTTPLEIADLQLDAPKAGELLLRIDAAACATAICRS
jgi:alcohol dehydrogenase